MGLRRQCNGCAEKAGERLIRDTSAKRSPTVRKLSCRLCCASLFHVPCSLAHLKAIYKLSKCHLQAILFPEKIACR